MNAVAEIGNHEHMAPAAEMHLPLPHERQRGLWGMYLFITTEAMLFGLFFFGYFYLAASMPRWPLEEDPKFIKALIMLVILLISSGVAAWGQKGIEHGNRVRLVTGLVLTLILSGGFMFVSYLEYREHLKTLTPQMNAYGSIFYTITSFHLAHLILGTLMLAYVLVRALAGHFSEHRHVAVKNTVLYWHFVDVVWIFVVSILYLSPQFYGPPS